MTLLELLVNELDEWPKLSKYYAQDSGGSVYPWLFKPVFNAESKKWVPEVSGMVLDFSAKSYYEEPRCVDYSSAIITRAQWEKAKNESN